MARGIVVYDSKGGNTEKLAAAIARGMQKAGLETKVKKVEKATTKDLVEADAVVLGSPTYFANMTAKMKDFIDRSIKIYPDKLKDKVGAVFTSYGGVGGDVTAISLILAMLLHRMIIVGHQSGEFGALSLETENEKDIADSEAFGERIGSLTKALLAGREPEKPKKK